MQLHELKNTNFNISLLTMLIILCIISFFFWLFILTPNETYITGQEKQLKFIKDTIEKYHKTYSKYPKKLDDLKNDYFQEIPLDPLTNAADWEVCDKNNLNVWYRTTKFNYTGAPTIWKPSNESEIIDIRPRNITH